MKELLEARRKALGWELWDIAKGVAALRDGTADKYYGAIKRLMKEPDRAEWRTLRDVWKAMGVDAEAVIGVAATIAQPPQEPNPPKSGKKSL